MYLPRSFELQDPVAIADIIDTADTAHLVTVTGDTPVASLIPVLWDPTTQRLHGHLARANPQARPVAGTRRALAIITGPQCYVSPSAYPSTAEHGQVVPTWNYAEVHITGELHLHEDAETLRRVVTELTRRQEGRREHPWSVADAPAAFITAQLRDIVAVELVATLVEAKLKLSQNRSAADRGGVVADLQHRNGSPAAGSRGAAGVAELMRRQQAARR